MNKQSGHNDANPLSHSKLFAWAVRKRGVAVKKGPSICIAFGSLASLPLTTCKFGMSIWDIRNIYCLVDGIDAQRGDIYCLINILETL